MMAGMYTGLLRANDGISFAAESAAIDAENADAFRKMQEAADKASREWSARWGDRAAIRREINGDW